MQRPIDVKSCASVVMQDDYLQQVQSELPFCVKHLPTALPLQFFKFSLDLLPLPGASSPTTFEPSSILPS